jgi:predicted nucleic acid-binding protein
LKPLAVEARGPVKLTAAMLLKSSDKESPMDKAKRIEIVKAMAARAATKDIRKIGPLVQRAAQAYDRAFAKMQARGRANLEGKRFKG